MSEFNNEITGNEEDDSEMELSEIVGEAAECFWAHVIERMPHLDLQQMSPNLDQDVADYLTGAVEKLIAANEQAAAIS